MADKYLDQAFDSVTSDLSKKLDPFHKGGAIDIHKAIFKVAPKKGFVMPGHRYTGPGNPLEQQLRYDPNTGQSYLRYINNRLKKQMLSACNMMLIIQLAATNQKVIK